MTARTRPSQAPGGANLALIANRMECVRVVPASQDIRTHLMLVCSGCGEELHKHGLPLNSPDEMLRHAADAAGWYVAPKGERASCPKCGERVRQPKRQTIAPSEASVGTLMTMRDHSKADKLADAVAVLENEPPIRRQRRLFELLDVHFDTVHGSYLPGWSDARIAEEAGGLSTAYVAKSRREGGWGEIKTSPEIEKATATLAELKTEMAVELAEYGALFEELKRTLHGRCDKLASELAMIRAKQVL